MKVEPTTPPAPTLNDSYREYVGLLLRRHHLLTEGKGDSPETEAIEDRLTDLWETLDGDQRRSLNGMASDLIWVRSGGSPPPKGLTRKEITPAMKAELEAAIARNDWHGILYHVRVTAQALRPECVAHNRGVCYQELGFTELAVVFFDFNAGSTSSGEYGIAALWRLRLLDRAAALRRASLILESPLLSPPNVVAYSVVLLADFDKEDRPPVTPAFLLSTLNDTIRRFKREPHSLSSGASLYRMAGSVFGLYGEDGRASECFELGLRHMPNDPMLLSGRGLSLYNKQPRRAVKYFMQAVRHGAKVFTPYVYLAHHSIKHRQFHRAVDYINMALERVTDDYWRGKLTSSLAVCRFELGESPDVVRSLFKRAMELDPTNAQIAANLEAFEDSAGLIPRHVDWPFGLLGPAEDAHHRGRIRGELLDYTDIDMHDCAAV